MIKQKEKGNLIVISGPSGSGKGTIIGKLLEKNKNIWLSISATTRDIRSNDIPNVTYFFYTKEEFEEKIRQDEFLEYAKYNEQYYGTPKSKINEKLNKGFDVILEIEIQGALQIKELIPDAIFIFIMPPSMEELKSRLVKRGTDSDEKIMKRFQRAYTEINEVTKYNYVVVNDNLDSAVQKVDAILRSERCRVDRIEEIYLNSNEEMIHEQLVDKKIANENRNI